MQGFLQYLAWLSHPPVVLRATLQHPRPRAARTLREPPNSGTPSPTFAVRSHRGASTKLMRFGRTPMSEKGDGRDHNPYGFTMWMAGVGGAAGMIEAVAGAAAPVRWEANWAVAEPEIAATPNKPSKIVRMAVPPQCEKASPSAGL